MATAARRLGRQDECNIYLENSNLCLDLARPSRPSVTWPNNICAPMTPPPHWSWLQTAATDKPDDIALQFTLLQALTATGMPQQALALMDELEEKTGAHPTILTKRAHVLRLIGQYHEAAAAARQATTLYPYNNAAWFERFQAEMPIAADDVIESLLAHAPAVTPQEKAQTERCRGAFAERQWRFRRCRRALSAGHGIACR